MSLDPLSHPGPLSLSIPLPLGEIKVRSRSRSSSRRQCGVWLFVASISGTELLVRLRRAVLIEWEGSGEGIGKEHWSSPEERQVYGT